MASVQTDVDEMRDWWRPANRDDFVKLAERLIGHGVPQDEAIDILGRAAGITADEYGD